MGRPKVDQLFGRLVFGCAWSVIITCCGDVRGQQRCSESCTYIYYTCCCGVGWVAKTMVDHKFGRLLVDTWSTLCGRVYTIDDVQKLRHGMNMTMC